MVYNLNRHKAYRVSGSHTHYHGERIIKDLGVTCFSRSGEWTAEGRFVAANGLVAC